MNDVGDRYLLVENFAKSALVAAFMLLAAVACSQSGGSEAEDRSVCDDPDAQWCYQDPGADGAYHVGHGVLYCYVDQVHREVAEGGITYREFFSESPGWVDEQQIDGKPIIVDLPHVPARDTGGIPLALLMRWNRSDLPLISSHTIHVWVRLASKRLRRNLRGLWRLMNEV